MNGWGPKSSICPSEPRESSCGSGSQYILELHVTVLYIFVVFATVGSSQPTMLPRSLNIFMELGPQNGPWLHNRATVVHMSWPSPSDLEGPSSSLRSCWGHFSSIIWSLSTVLRKTKTASSTAAMDVLAGTRPSLGNNTGIAYISFKRSLSQASS